MEVGLVPALEKAATPEAREKLLDCARKEPVRTLQSIVSATVGAKPRGIVQADHLKNAILNAMPDLEARELFERFLHVGRVVTKSTSTVGILLAAMCETLGSWEPNMPREAN